MQTADLQRLHRVKFGRLLRGHRLRLGWKVRDLAAAAGIPHASTISRWEHGSRIAEPSNVAALADALGLTGDERLALFLFADPYIPYMTADLELPDWVGI